MTHVRYCSFRLGSPEPALAAVDRRSCATTQNALATGNKVNTALDNPTEFFTAQGLNNRASDISNLLDGIGNGVQVLQAANTGITSLQSLVASAQSIANQVLQTPVGYSTKSNVTTAADRGRDREQPARHRHRLYRRDVRRCTSTGNHRGLYQRQRHRHRVNNDDTTVVPISTSTLLVGTAGTTSNDLATAITDGSTLVVNGKTITFSTATTSSTGSAASGFTIGIGAGSTASVATVLSDIDAITGSATASSVTGGKLVLQTGTTAGLTITGTGNALAALGLGAGVTQARAGGATRPQRWSAPRCCRAPSRPRSASYRRLHRRRHADGRRQDADVRDRRRRRQPDLTTGTVANLLARSIPPAATPARPPRSAAAASCCTPAPPTAR